MRSLLGRSASNRRVRRQHLCIEPRPAGRSIPASSIAIQELQVFANELTQILHEL
jgi:hypothetical protein